MAIRRNTVGDRWAQNTTAPSSMTLNLLGANLAVGDRIFGLVTAIGSNPTITPPSGWTLLATYKPATTMVSAVYYRDWLVDNQSSITQTWNMGVTGTMLVAYIPFAAADLNIAPTATQNNTLTGSRTVNSPSTAMADADRCLIFVCGRQATGSGTEILWTSPTDGNEWFNGHAPLTAPTAQLTIDVWDSGHTPAGNYTRAFVADQNLTEAHVWSIRLRPSVTWPSPGMKLR